VSIGFIIFIYLIGSLTLSLTIL